MNLTGVFVPLITPLNPDETIDEASLERVIEYVLTGGANGIFVLGSSGEFVNLSLTTKKSLIRASKEIINGRVPLLVGISRAGTQPTIEEAQQWLPFEPDGLVALAPYYYRHSQAELVTHFATIADALQTPLVLYNIPEFANHVIEPETVAQLAGNPYIVGIKNTARDMDAFDQLLAVRDAQGGSFQVSQGDLPNAAECLLRGADGITLGVASVAPHLCSEMYAAAQAGDRARAEAINLQLNHVNPVGLSRSWFAGLKMLCSLLGLCQPVVARPFAPVTEADIVILRRRLLDLEMLPEAVE